MGYFLDSCPAMNRYCYCIPLRAGAFIIALLGLGFSFCFLWSFTPTGLRFYAQALPEEFYPVHKFMNWAFGVLLIALHLLLAAAAVRENDVLLEVYIWAMIVLWFVIAFYAVIVLFAACFIFSYQFALLYLVALYVPLFAWLYSIVSVGAYRLALP